jgi:hypothetical protein
MLGSSRMEQAEPEVMPPQGNVPKSFLAFLAEQGQGAVVSELSDRLRDLTEAIEMHFEHFRGKVTGEINVKMKLILEGGAYKVITEYTVKAPKAPANGTIMWLGPDGNLATSNPRQLAMPFRGVGAQQ